MISSSEPRAGQGGGGGVDDAPFYEHRNVPTCVKLRARGSPLRGGDTSGHDFRVHAVTLPPLNADVSDTELYFYNACSIWTRDGIRFER